MFNFALLDEKTSDVRRSDDTSETESETVSYGFEIARDEEAAGSISDDWSSMETDTWEDVCRAVGTHAETLVDRILWKPARDIFKGLTTSRRDLSQNILSAWAQSYSANSILKLFTLEGVVETADVMTLEDVRHLLAAANLRPKFIASKFKQYVSDLDVDETLNQILRSFASHAVEGKLVMTFHDVYRLLENIDVGRRRFVKMFIELDDDEFYAYDRNGRLQIYRDLTPGFGPALLVKHRIGNYVISEEIGAGLQGGKVYKAEGMQKTKVVALKWPVQRDELEALKTIQNKVANSSFLGLPELLDSGTHDGRPYAVTELLGADLTKVFLRLQRHSWKRRWNALRIFGRLVLRRLEAVHDCGYVHCDVSPLNILLGRVRGNYDFCGQLQFVPFLIDYGQARKYPGGGKLSGDKSSMEWSSIGSADGGEPTPVDDFEALGWTLVYGLVGNLPWLEALAKYYAENPPSMAQTIARKRIVEKVRDGKVQLLDKGWTSFGAEWWNLAVVPEELLRFLELCRTKRLPAGRPGYAVLHELLGGKPGLNERAAELEDLRNYQDDVLPLL